MNFYFDVLKEFGRPDQGSWEKMLAKLEQAKANNEVLKVSYTTILFTGASGVGKTTLLKKLNKEDLNRYHHSTGVAKSTHKVCIKTTALGKTAERWQWTDLDYDSTIQYLNEHLQDSRFPPSRVTATALPLEERIPSSLAAETGNQQNIPESLTSASSVTENVSVSSATSETVMKKKVAKAELAAVDIAKANSSNTPLLGEVLDIVNFLDTGGQPEFVNILPAVSSSIAITFIVFNLTKNLSDLVHVQRNVNGDPSFESYYLDCNNLEFIKRLMVSTENFNKNVSSSLQLTSIPRKDKGNNSKICLIGTHALDIKKEKIKEIDDQLTSVASELGLHQRSFWASPELQLKRLFPVDMFPTVNEDKKLLEEIIEVVRENIQNQVQEPDYHDIPICWLIFLLNLQKLCNIKKIRYISYQEAVDVWMAENNLGTKLYQISQADLVCRDETEVHNILLFFHFIGMLFYYHKVEGMRDFVFIDCQWLFEKLTELVEIKFTKGFNKKNISTEIIDKFTIKGRLNIDIIENLKVDLQGIQPLHFIYLLDHLNIVALIDSKMEEYFMPCVLPMFAENVRNLDKYYGTIKFAPLLVGFKNGPMPHGFFCQVVVELLRKLPTGWLSPLLSTSRIQRVYNNLITFPTASGHAVSLFYRISYLEIQVRHEDTQSTIIHCDVRNELDKVIRKVFNLLQMNEEQLCYGFYCKCENIKHFVRLEKLSFTTNYLFCACGKTEITEEYSIWLQEVKDSRSNSKQLQSGDWHAKFEKMIFRYLWIMNSKELRKENLCVLQKQVLAESTKAEKIVDYFGCYHITLMPSFALLFHDKYLESGLLSKLDAEMPQQLLCKGTSMKYVGAVNTMKDLNEFCGFFENLDNLEIDFATNMDWQTSLMVVKSSAGQIAKSVTSLPDTSTIDKGRVDTHILGISNFSGINELIDLSMWLKQRYIQIQRRFDLRDWPLIHPRIVSSYALVHHKQYGLNKFTTKAEELFFVLDGSITLKMMDCDKPIMHSVGSLFETHESTKFILIEGQPGIGKSTLVKQIAYQWSMQQPWSKLQKPIFQRFQLLLLLFLRDPIVQQLSHLGQLLHLFWRRNTEVTLSSLYYLLKSGGKDLVLVLDGYDECPPNILHEGSLIGDILKRKLLPRCHLIVTSRPSASATLWDKVDIRVEILGFSENERNSYIKKALNNESHKINELAHYLSGHPAIGSLCYIPFNLAILLYLYKCGNSLPKNLAELYYAFLSMTINPQKLIDLSKLYKEPCNNKIKQLSKWSFEALISNKWSFTPDELEGVCLDIDFVIIDGYGFLQEVEHFSYLKTFYVLHSSIQEFLAAYYIFTLDSGEEELKILAEKFWIDTYLNVFSIYLTLSKGQRPSFKRFASDVVLTTSLEDQLKSLRLFYCFREVDSTELKLYEQSKKFIEKEIHFVNAELTRNDMKCIAVCLTSFNKVWRELDLSGCDIQDYGIHVLHRELSCIKKEGMKIVTIQLNGNGLTKAASPLISDIIINCKVKKLRINGNHSIGEGHKLYSMLANSTTLKSLYLVDTSLSSNAVSGICMALECNNTLQELIITNNNVSDDGCVAISKVLQNNSSLVKLWMWNNPIHSEALVSILKSLQTNDTLALLGFPNCPEKTKIKLASLQQLVNERRTNNGCCVKLVIDFM